MKTMNRYRKQKCFIERLERDVSDPDVGTITDCHHAIHDVCKQIRYTATPISHLTTHNKAQNVLRDFIRVKYPQHVHAISNTCSNY